MNSNSMNRVISSFDERRDVVIPGNKEESIRFSALYFLDIGKKAIQEKGQFFVALSGGTTPTEIYRTLSQEPYRNAIDWNRVNIFWSDERCVPPDHRESNYFMAMASGLSALPIPQENIFRMQGELDPEESAKLYEHLISTQVPNRKFDLIMLGMGEDGHTASLFPKTHGLHTENRLTIANFIPQKDCWRLSLTFECINSARHIAIIVLGASKSKILSQVLESHFNPDIFPVQGIGTPSQKALWIADNSAAAELTRSRPPHNIIKS